MKNLLARMPLGVYPLLLVKTLSIFSYAILYSSLSLYLVHQLKLSIYSSNVIVGLFLVFYYCMQLLGGIFANKILSSRSLFYLSILLQISGLLLLLFQENFLYLGLSFFAVGGGVNATCFNIILTNFFKNDDLGRENAFFLSYALINLGFCSGFIVSGLFDLRDDYHSLFYWAFFANIISFLAGIKYWKLLKIANENFQTNYTNSSVGFFIIVGLIPLVTFLFHQSLFCHYGVLLVSFITVNYIVFIALRSQNAVYKDRIFAYLCLTFFSTIFWMIYYTGPMAVTLFIKNNVDRSFLTYQLATQWVLNTNALVVIIGTPIITTLLIKCKSKGINISITQQFICAFILLGISFFVLAYGIKQSNSLGYCSVFWVILHFIFQGFAELLIAPMGYAMIGKIIPSHLQSLLMGSWMMISGLAASLSHFFSNSMIKEASLNPLITNTEYYFGFCKLAVWAIVGGALLMLSFAKINLFMQEKVQLQAQ